MTKQSESLSQSQVARESTTPCRASRDNERDFLERDKGDDRRDEEGGHARAAGGLGPRLRR